MGWLGDSSHRGQGCQAWTAVGLPPRYPYNQVYKRRWCKTTVTDWTIHRHTNRPSSSSWTDQVSHRTRWNCQTVGQVSDHQGHCQVETPPLHTHGDTKLHTTVHGYTRCHKTTQLSTLKSCCPSATLVVSIIVDMGIVCVYVYCTAVFCVFAFSGFQHLFLQYFDTVGCVFWPVKTVARITYTVLV